MKQAGFPGEKQSDETQAAYDIRKVKLQQTCYAFSHLINEVKQADVTTVVTGNGAGTDSLGGVHAPGPTNLAVTGSGAGGPTSGSGGLT
jgi:hypothetical protein